MLHFLFSLVLSLTISVFSTSIAGGLIPGLYGSCFEGSCAYMQIFLIIPLGALLLFWPASRLIETLGLLTRLVLAFPISWIFGYLIFGEFGLTVVPLIFLTLAVLKYKKAKGKPVRDLFIKPSAVFPHDTK